MDAEVTIKETSNRRMVKVGILRESKTPPDSRVPFTPDQCVAAKLKFPELEIVVQTSRVDPNQTKVAPRASRCIGDDEYIAKGIPVVEKVDDCDILIGIKEVDPRLLIPGKTYMFFSHTIKAQPHNRALLQEILARGIRLIDFELLTDDRGFRLVGFGRWAGIVGLHNALYTWLQRHGQNDLARMHSISGGYAEAKSRHYRGLSSRLKRLRLVLTGDGRVSTGCVEVLEACGVRRISPEQFLDPASNDTSAVFCQLPADKLYAKPVIGPDGATEQLYWDNDFFKNPAGYVSQLPQYLRSANVLVNGIYWDKSTAPLFTLEDMQDPHNFTLAVISDITCDLAPDSSIPATICASTIDDPIFGFDPRTGDKAAPEDMKDGSVVWMTTIDNLPNELPRDSSKDFGEKLLSGVLPELLTDGEVTERATIADSGRLKPKFSYLRDFVNGH